MTRIIAILLCLTSTASAASAGDTLTDADRAIVPPEPTEYQKIEALKLGYLLNGNSMVRWGSIDLTDPLVLSTPSSVAPIKVLPTKPVKAK